MDIIVRKADTRPHEMQCFAGERYRGRRTDFINLHSNKLEKKKKAVKNSNSLHCDLCRMILNSVDKSHVFRER